MTTSWDAILFDFDGVLADTEPLHYACWKQILADYSITLDWQYYVDHCVGTADRHMIQTLAAQRVPPISFDELWVENERKRIMFTERLLASLPFRDDTTQLVRELSAQYKLAVVSSSSRSEVEPPLELAGLRPYFQALVCGKEVPNLKPAPDPYLRAAELLGSTRPLVIEDSAAGIASAKAAGFDVLKITAPDTVADEVRRFLA
jgi:HAD superfamily hydrolase (TIGR01509 family)